MRAGEVKAGRTAAAVETLPVAETASPMRNWPVGPGSPAEWAAIKGERFHRKQSRFHQRLRGRISYLWATD